MSIALDPTSGVGSLSALYQNETQVISENSEPVMMMQGFSISVSSHEPLCVRVGASGATSRSFTVVPCHDGLGHATLITLSKNLQYSTRHQPGNAIEMVMRSKRFFTIGLQDV